MDTGPLPSFSLARTNELGQATMSDHRTSAANMTRSPWSRSSEPNCRWSGSHRNSQAGKSTLGRGSALHQVDCRHRVVAAVVAVRIVARERGHVRRQFNRVDPQFFEGNQRDRFVVARFQRPRAASKKGIKVGRDSRHTHSSTFVSTEIVPLDGFRKIMLGRGENFHHRVVPPLFAGRGSNSGEPCPVRGRVTATPQASRISCGAA